MLCLLEGSASRLGEFFVAEQIELDLRLGPRRTHRDGISAWTPIAAGQLEHEHVAFGSLHRFGLGLVGPSDQRSVIADCQDVKASDRLRWIGSKSIHEPFHVGHPLATFHLHVDQVLEIDTVLEHQFVEPLMKCLAGRFEVGCKLGHQQTGHGPVFVSCVGSDQIAVGFLGSKDETFGSTSVDQTCDPFETHMDVSLAADPLGFGYAASHLGGDQGFDDVSVFGKIASLLAFRDDVVGQEHAELVAIDRSPRAIGLEAYRAGAAHPIAIRIGGQGDIGLDALGVLDHGVEDGGVFRVAHVPRDIREIAVGGRMRTILENLGKTRRSEQFRNDKSSDTMQG